MVDKNLSHEMKEIPIYACPRFYCLLTFNVTSYVTSDTSLCFLYFVSLIHSLLLNLIVTSLHIIKILLAYMLMLAVMTFNYWVLLVIVLAAVVGYFLRPLTESFICWSSTSSQHENIVAKDEERRPYIPLRESSV